MVTGDKKSMAINVSWTWKGHTKDPDQDSEGLHNGPLRAIMAIKYYAKFVSMLQQVRDHACQPNPGHHTRPSPAVSAPATIMSSRAAPSAEISAQTAVVQDVRGTKSRMSLKVFNQAFQTGERSRMRTVSKL